MVPAFTLRSGPAPQVCALRNHLSAAVLGVIAPASSTKVSRVDPADMAITQLTVQACALLIRQGSCGIEVAAGATIPRSIIPIAARMSQLLQTATERRTAQVRRPASARTRRCCGTALAASPSAYGPPASSPLLPCLPQSSATCFDASVQLLRAMLLFHTDDTIAWIRQHGQGHCAGTAPSAAAGVWQCCGWDSWRCRQAAARAGAAAMVGPEGCIVMRLQHRAGGAVEDCSHAVVRGVEATTVHKNPLGVS